MVYADEDGVREVGTLARVAEVLERFDDGRLNVVVEGSIRFRVEQLTRGRSFMTAERRARCDDERRRRPGHRLEGGGLVPSACCARGRETDELDERRPQLSFELAAQVELPPDSKQQLLELRTEQERLEAVAELLDDARTRVDRDARARRAREENGSGQLSRRSGAAGALRRARHQAIRSGRFR
jgi:ATP-dependent Lon protease